MNLFTWNINYDDRAVGRYASFSWENRRYMVCAFLRSVLLPTTIFHLQEVMPEYCEELKGLFQETHHIFTELTHPCGRQLFTAVPKSLEAIKIEVPMVSEKHRQVFLKVRVLKNKLTEGFDLVNVHFPMGKEWRFDFSHHLTKIVSGRTIIAGDFNTFPDDGGYEQVRIIQSGGMYDATNLILDVDTEERVLKTFTLYPYDTVPLSALAAPPFNIDHIFISGQIKHDTPVSYNVNYIVKIRVDFKGVEDLSEENRPITKEELEDKVKCESTIEKVELIYEGKKYGASDHHALSIYFEP